MYDIALHYIGYGDFLSTLVSGTTSMILLYVGYGDFRFPFVF